MKIYRKISNDQIRINKLEDKAILIDTHLFLNRNLLNVTMTTPRMIATVLGYSETKHRGKDSVLSSITSYLHLSTPDDIYTEQYNLQDSPLKNYTIIDLTEHIILKKLSKQTHIPMHKLFNTYLLIKSYMNQSDAIPICKANITTLSNSLCCNRKTLTPIISALMAGRLLSQSPEGLIANKEVSQE